MTLTRNYKHKFDRSWKVKNRKVKSQVIQAMVIMLANTDLPVT